jgi:hypothetical protein
MTELRVEATYVNAQPSTDFIAILHPKDIRTLNINIKQKLYLESVLIPSFSLAQDCC